jgi:hypothetical protein
LAGIGGAAGALGDAAYHLPGNVLNGIKHAPETARQIASDLPGFLKGLAEAAVPGLAGDVEANQAPPNLTWKAGKPVLTEGADNRSPVEAAASTEFAPTVQMLESMVLGGGVGKLLGPVAKGASLLTRAGRGLITSEAATAPFIANPLAEGKPKDAALMALLAPLADLGVVGASKGIGAAGKAVGAAMEARKAAGQAAKALRSGDVVAGSTLLDVAGTSPSISKAAPNDILSTAAGGSADMAPGARVEFVSQQRPEMMPGRLAISTEGKLKKQLTEADWRSLEKPITPGSPNYLDMVQATVDRMRGIDVPRGGVPAGFGPTDIVNATITPMLKRVDEIRNAAGAEVSRVVKDAGAVPVPPARIAEIQSRFQNMVADRFAGHINNDGTISAISGRELTNPVANSQLQKMWETVGTIPDNATVQLLQDVKQRLANMAKYPRLGIRVSSPELNSVAQGTAANIDHTLDDVIGKSYSAANENYGKLIRFEGAFARMLGPEINAAQGLSRHGGAAALRAVNSISDSGWRSMLRQLQEITSTPGNKSPDLLKLAQEANIAMRLSGDVKQASQASGLLGTITSMIPGADKVARGVALAKGITGGTNQGIELLQASANKYADFHNLPRINLNNRSPIRIDYLERGPGDAGTIADAGSPPALPPDAGSVGGAADAGAASPLSSESGAIGARVNPQVNTPGGNPASALSLLTRMAGGGAVGGTAGAMIPGTPEERARNMLLGAGAGALGGPFLSRPAALARALGRLPGELRAGLAGEGGMVGADVLGQVAAKRALVERAKAAGRADGARWYAQTTGKPLPGPETAAGDAKQFKDMLASAGSESGAIGTDAVNKAAAPKVKTAAEQHEAQAVRYFGATSEPKMAGYITKKGTYLDFSGRRQGNTNARERAMDHREIGAGISDNPGGTEGMQQFMSEGNIRMDYNAGAFDLLSPPSPEQRRVLERLISRKNGEVVIEADRGLGEYSQDYYRPVDPFNREYPAGTPASRIMHDIDTYYAGKMPNNPSIAQQYHDQSGSASPELLSLLGRMAGGGVAGGTAGLVAGQTPDERRLYALLGLLGGAGLAGGAPALIAGTRGAVDTMRPGAARFAEKLASGAVPLVTQVAKRFGKKATLLETGIDEQRKRDEQNAAMSAVR